MESLRRWGARLSWVCTGFAAAWWALATFVLAMAVVHPGLRLSAALSLYLLATSAVSVLAWASYGVDKRRAAANQPRIAERTLHLLSLCGGWPGAQLGRLTFHHKTQKWSFRVIFWLIFGLQAAGLIGVLWQGGWRQLRDVLIVALGGTPAN